MPALQKAALKWGLATIMKNDEPIPYNWKSTTPKEHRLRGLITPTGVIMSADNKENKVEVVPRPKLIDALNPPAWLKIALGILAVLAASLIGAAEMGIALPALLISIAKVVSAILVGLGITSAGVSAQEKKE